MNRFCGVVSFVFGGECFFGYYIKGISGIDFYDMFGNFFGKKYILCFNLFDRRSKLVGEKFDKECVGEFLFNFGMYFGGVVGM